MLYPLMVGWGLGKDTYSMMPLLLLALTYGPL